MSFGLIPWSDKMQQYKPTSHDSYQEIQKLISIVDPDVLGLQESSTSEQSQQQYQLLQSKYAVSTCNADPGWFAKLQNVLVVNKNLKQISRDFLKFTSPILFDYITSDHGSRKGASSSFFRFRGLACCDLVFTTSKKLMRRRCPLRAWRRFFAQGAAPV